MTTLEEISAVQKQIELAKQDHQRAVGALEQVLSSLQKDHGCKTPEEARSKLTKLERKIAEGEKELTDAIAAFRGKYEGA